MNIPLTPIINTIEKHGPKKGTKIVATGVGIGLFVAGIGACIYIKIKVHGQRKKNRGSNQICKRY